MKRKFQFIVERTNTGYSAYHEALAMGTTGETIADLNRNVLEVMNMMYEEKNIEIGPENIIMQLDIAQFFTFYKEINAKHLAKRIGMNSALLSQYVRGHKKPTPRQAQRIVDGIHDLGQELSQVSLIQ